MTVIVGNLLSSMPQGLFYWHRCHKNRPCSAAPGLRSYLLGYHGIDRGHLIENAVFLELMR